jgi:hypothetical protein
VTGIEIALLAGGALALAAVVRALRAPPATRGIEQIARFLEQRSMQGVDEVWGRYEDRRVRAKLSWSDASWVVHIAIEVEHGKPLLIRRAGLPERLARASGLEPSEAGSIAAGDLARVRRDFERDQQPLVSALRNLFDALGAETLEAKHGLLSIELPLPPRGPNEDFERWILLVLNELSRVAHAYERRPIVVRVLGSERFAWTGGEGHRPRCPYCHSEVTGEEADLVACSACGTVHHEGCFTEHGRCTVLGCDSSKAERGREKA